MIAMKRTGLAVLFTTLVAAGACGRNEPLDDALKADLAAAGATGDAGDLQLAPKAAKSQMVLSAIEGGPAASPQRAAPKRIVRPSAKPTTRAAAQRVRAPAPVAVADSPEPAPVETAPAMQAPAPAPAPAPRQDNRVYKTEAEIFRQMPWIKP